MQHLSGWSSAYSDLVVDDAETAPLKKRTHVWMAVTGTILTIAGITGVFIKDTNVAGVPLLILAGAAFLYVAITGQQLIQVSKDGVTFAALRRTLAEATEDPKIPEEAQARIVEIAEDNGVHLGVLGPRELEQRAFRMLQDLGEMYDFDVTEPPRGLVDFELVRRSDGVKAGVELTARLLDPRGPNDSLARLRQSDYPHKILVMTRNVKAPFNRPLENGIVIAAVPEMRHPNPLRRALQASGFLTMSD